MEALTTRNLSTTSLSSVFEQPTRTAPLIIVGSPNGSAVASQHDAQTESNETTDAGGGEFNSSITAQVLATKWHEYSDEAIQSAISTFSVSESPAEVSSHPYHSALRVLSSHLSRVRMELEESRRKLMEKEGARRSNADELMKQLQPSEQDIARRVIQTIFTEEDDDRRRVRKQQSFMVCVLLDHSAW